MKFGRVEFTAQGLKESKVSEWLLRFAFGGTVSVVAALVSERYGPSIGGLFLAFPSILPATLTLIVHHRTRKDAADDAFGAGLGSLALVLFATTILLGTPVMGLVPALIAASGAWLIGSIILWKILA